MAILDKQLIMSDNEAVTVTAFSGDVIDTGNVSVGRNIGRGGWALRWVVDVLAAVTAAGAATVKFELVEADDAAGTGANVLCGTDVIGKAALGLGVKAVSIEVPDTSKRYIMTRYTVATGPLTAGKFTSRLQVGSSHHRAYPGGYSIGV